MLSLPLSFHGDIHSGRLMKVMLGGSESDVQRVADLLPRAAVATYVAVLVLLPLTLFLNWQLPPRR